MSQSQSTLLISLTDHLELFHDADRAGYATIEFEGHKEHWAIRAKGFKDWLRYQFYQTYDKVPNVQAVQDAVNTIEGKAVFEGSECEVYTRIAHHDQQIYVDMGDSLWRVIQIDGDGWQVISNSPIKFRRPRGMRPLPEPIRGGEIDRFWRFANIKKSDRILVLAWIVAAFRPIGPYPVLVLQGEQGTAKSSLVRTIKNLIDPSNPELRTKPRNEHDFILAARNSWVVTFDNLSGLPDWLSDALCRLATGGGFSTRQLYTDTEEILIDVMRPSILNGIDDIATREDLIDRAIVLNLEPISNDQRRDEVGLWRDFNEIKPELLGSLLDHVVDAIRNLPSTHLTESPRMADFAKWSVAAFGDAFLIAYQSSVQSAVEIGLEGSLVAQAVRGFMANRSEWTGKPGELYELLNKAVSESTQHLKEWPKAPNKLSEKLRRIAPNLRKVGIDIGWSRQGSARLVTLENTRNLPSLSSLPSQCQQNQAIPGDDCIVISDGNEIGPSPLKPSTGVGLDDSDGNDGILPLCSDLKVVDL